MIYANATFFSHPDAENKPTSSLVLRTPPKPLPGLCSLDEVERGRCSDSTDLSEQAVLIGRTRCNMPNISHRLVIRRRIVFIIVHFIPSLPIVLRCSFN